MLGHSDQENLQYNWWCPIVPHSLATPTLPFILVHHYDGPIEIHRSTVSKVWEIFNRKFQNLAKQKYLLLGGFKRRKSHQRSAHMPAFDDRKDCVKRPYMYPNSPGSAWIGQIWIHVWTDWLYRSFLYSRPFPDRSVAPAKASSSDLCILMVGTSPRCQNAIT